MSYEINEIRYEPTPTNIMLSDAQDSLMCQAIRHIEDAPSVMKKATRWQFWFRQIYDAGFRAAEAVQQSEGNKTP